MPIIYRLFELTVRMNFRMKEPKICSFATSDEGLTITASFFSGETVEFDVSSMFADYPQYRVLENNRDLWKSARLFPQGDGVYFNDDLDLTPEEILEGGTLVAKTTTDLRHKVATLVTQHRLLKNLSQQQLSKLTGISQCDISRIEGAVANPTLDTLEKVFKALDVIL